MKSEWSCVSGSATFPFDSNKEVLAGVSYTPSAKARERIKKNCERAERSRKSKIMFCGPLPVKVS